MATFDIAAAYTLPEILRTRAPDGSHMAAVDTLSGKFPLIEEGYWVQANDDTSHEYLRMTSEPTGNLVRLNEGAAFEAASTTPVRETLARMESNMKIDTRILERAPDPVAYRREREAAHVRGMIKQWSKIVFGSRDSASGTVYGDSAVNPLSIDGLRKRYSSLTSVSPTNVVSNLGDTADVQGSIWLVKWGQEGVFFIYPKTASRTLQVRDLKEQVVYDASSRPYTAVMTNFSFEFGLGVADHRAVQRIANVGVDEPTGSFGDPTSTATSQITEGLLIDAIERLPMGDAGNAAFYVGPKIMAAFRKALNNKSNLYFSMDTVWGRPQLTFMGVPVIRCDGLNQLEAVVT